MSLVDAMDVHFGIIMILLQSLALTSGSCPLSQNYYATTSTKYLSHRYYSNNEDCTFNISPSGLYNTDGYFLEVRWSSFDVKGKMPNCNEDYVEVFLTRSQKSIGKFCSDNFRSTPFRMYSHDGMIKIKFKSDGSKTGSGFQLSYKLLRRSSSYLGYSYCSNGYNSALSGNLYSPKYPTRYSYGSDCTYKISADSGKVVKIVFMDIDLKSYVGSFYCSSLDDYVDVKATDTSYYSYYSSSTVKSKICSTSSIVTVTTRKDYVYVKFHRNVVSSSVTRRGFVAGYVIYDEDPLSSSSVGAIVGIVVAVIIIVIVIGIVAFYCKRRRRPGAVLLSNQPNTASHVTTTTTTTSTAAVDQYPKQDFGYPNQPQQQVPYSSAGFTAQPPPPYSQAASYPTLVNAQAYQPYPLVEVKDNPPMQHTSPYPPPQVMPPYAPQPKDASAYPAQPPLQGYAPYPNAPPPSYPPSSGAPAMPPPTA